MLKILYREAAHSINLIARHPITLAWFGYFNFLLNPLLLTECRDVEQRDRVTHICNVAFLKLFPSLYCSSPPRCSPWLECDLRGGRFYVCALVIDFSVACFYVWKRKRSPGKEHPSVLPPAQGFCRINLPLADLWSAWPFQDVVAEDTCKFSMSCCPARCTSLV